MAATASDGLGEILEGVYYRGDEKQTAKAKLGTRPDA